MLYYHTVDAAVLCREMFSGGVQFIQSVILPSLIVLSIKGPVNVRESMAVRDLIQMQLLSYKLLCRSNNVWIIVLTVRHNALTTVVVVIALKVHCI